MQSIILLTAGGAVVGGVDEGAAEAEGAAEFFTNHIRLQYHIFFSDI